jgi:hypothetical protein
MTTQRILNTVGTSRTTGIATASVAHAAGYLGSEIDNSTNKDTLCAIQVTWTLAATPTAGEPLYVYILYAIDGTNYEDGGTALQPRKGPEACIGVPANATANVETRIDIPLAPFKFKLLVWNGTAAKDITSLLTVLCQTYNPDIQAAA